MVMPSIFLVSFLLGAVLLGVQAQNVIEYVLVFMFLSLITATYAYLRRGTTTIHISAEGVWFDNDLILWRNVRSVRYTGGVQDGIRIVIRFNRGKRRLAREQFLDPETNMFEIADEIERLGNICVDINSTLSRLR